MFEFSLRNPMTPIERGPLGVKILNRTPSCKGVGSLIVISSAGGNGPYSTTRTEKGAAVTYVGKLMPQRYRIGRFDFTTE